MTGQTRIKRALPDVARIAMEKHQCPLRRADRFPYQTPKLAFFRPAVQVMVLCFRQQRGQRQ